MTIIIMTRGGVTRIPGQAIAADIMMKTATTTKRLPLRIRAEAALCLLHAITAELSRDLPGRKA